jgi:tetratricopeptide (TPR) repeat protein
LRKHPSGDAIKDISEAIRLNPDFSNAYSARGLVRQLQGDLDGALGDYQKYLELAEGIQHGDQYNIEERMRDLKKRL